MPKQCCKDFFNKLSDEVPVFTISGNDKLAPAVVAYWHMLAADHRVNQGKLNRAYEHLLDIEAYQKQHPERVKLPD